jgi:teichuronic acid biosynthesis glycosyltransferase TuaC
MTDAMWLTGGYPWVGDPVAGNFFRTQAQALSRLGLDLTVVAPMPAAPWPLSRMRVRWRLHAASPREEHDGAVRVVRPRFLNVPGQPAWAVPDRFVARAAWAARHHWEGARLIHGHYAVTGLAAWRLARRAGLPFVLTFHGDDMNTWPDDYPGRRSDLRRAVREAGLVIAVSKALAERVREVTGVDALALPLGSHHAALAEMRVPRDEARSRLSIPADQIVVLYVGYLLRRKGVRELADAILEVGDPLIGMFVGDGPEAGYGLGSTGAPVRIRYQGARSHNDVILHMSAADVLVLPSEAEGLPTVIVEAGSVGLPVIASSAGGIPELLSDGRGTILPEISARAIATALRTFLEERDEARASSLRLRDLVVRDYDVDRNASRLLDLYRSVAGGLVREGVDELLPT